MRRPDGASRRIYFYRLDAGLETSGKRTPFDVRPALSKINLLPFQDGGRYMDNGDGNTTCAWVDRLGQLPRLRLATIRKTELPQVEEGGLLAELDIPVDGGLVEAMHLVFFPDNVVGGEFNFYGPRASRLREYLKHAAAAEAQELKSVRPIGLENVFDQLKTLGSIRLLTIKARPSYAATLAREDRDLASILNAAASIGGVDQVSFGISVEPRSRDTHLATKLFDAVKRLARKRQITPEQVSKFEVQGYSADLNRLETIDLLKEFLVSEQKVTKVEGRSRGYVSASVYAAIEQAHGELRDQIRTAVDL
jgi:hypothetical protein